MKKFAIILAMLASSAHAEFMTGNKLLELMQEKDSPTRSSFSIGYVIGVSDSGAGAVHCAPQDVTAGQVRDLVKAYLEQSPAVRHLPADTIILSLMKTAWPCARKGGSAL